MQAYQEKKNQKSETGVNLAKSQSEKSMQKREHTQKQQTGNIRLGNKLD